MLSFDAVLVEQTSLQQGKCGLVQWNAVEETGALAVDVVLPRPVFREGVPHLDGFWSERLAPQVHVGLEEVEDIVGCERLNGWGFGVCLEFVCGWCGGRDLGVGGGLASRHWVLAVERAAGRGDRLNSR